MYKQEQIEEMAQCKNAFGFICNDCKFINACERYDLAEELYNAGYRKIPEGSVVLEKEEYERLVKTAQGKIGNMKSNDFLKACISSGVMVEAVSTEEQVKQAYEKGCKETAEKCFNIFKLHKANYYDIPLDLVASSIQENIGVELEW